MEFPIFLELLFDYYIFVLLVEFMTIGPIFRADELPRIALLLLLDETEEILLDVWSYIMGSIAFLLLLFAYEL